MSYLNSVHQCGAIVASIGRHSGASKKQCILESTVMTAMQRIGEAFYQALECGAIASDC